MQNSNLRPTVFLDRDGTINYDAGYINHINSFRVYPFAAEAIRLLNLHNFLVVIITNQSGIGRGFFDIKTLNTLHEYMLKTLSDQGAIVDAIYFCPHDIGSKDMEYKIDCTCRKPHPGMLLQAITELPINQAEMFFIGDKSSDIEAGAAAGATTYLVKTGYGEGDIDAGLKKYKSKPDNIVDNLIDAVLDILKKIDN